VASSAPAAIEDRQQAHVPRAPGHTPPEHRVSAQAACEGPASQGPGRSSISGTVAGGHARGDPRGSPFGSVARREGTPGLPLTTAAYLNRGLRQVARRGVVVGWCGSDRSAGARAYLGARPCGRRRDGRWVDPRGTTPAARSLVDRRPWAGVATAAGAGRKIGCHLGVVGRRKRIGGRVRRGARGRRGRVRAACGSSAARACARSSATPGCARARAP
jgi:hypothetical protein